jgi:hypothetical protein
MSGDVAPSQVFVCSALLHKLEVLQGLDLADAGDARIYSQSPKFWSRWVFSSGSRHTTGMSRCIARARRPTRCSDRTLERGITCTGRGHSAHAGKPEASRRAVRTASAAADRQTRSEKETSPPRHQSSASASMGFFCPHADRAAHLQAISDMTP